MLQCFKDPLLALKFRNGGTPQILQWLFSTWPVTRLAKLLGWAFLGRQFHNISINEYISRIDVPLLIIRGERDAFVPFEDSQRMFDNASGNSCMLTLPAVHTRNHIDCKELYAHLIKEFIETQSADAFFRKIAGH